MNIFILDDTFLVDGEFSFLDTEVVFYPDFFKLYIVNFNSKSVAYKQSNKNCKIIYNNKEEISKKYYLKTICQFSPKIISNMEFWKEIRYLIKTRKMNGYTLTKLLYFLASSEKIIKQIERFINDEIIETENSIIYSYWLYRQAYVAVRLKEKYPLLKSVSRAHGYDLYEYRNKYDYLPFRQYLMKGLDKIYVISKYGEEYLNENYGTFTNVEIARLGSIDCGINPWVKQQLFTIVSCSSLIEVKRIHRIAESIALINKEQRSKIKWIHFGDGKEMSKIIDYARENLTEVSYHFYGNVENNTVLDYYKKNSVDLFVNVSKSEGIPVSIMEAASFSIPVIATNVGGTPEIVITQCNGVLLNEDFSNEELASYIKFFMDMNVNEMEEFRKNSREVWRNKYDAEKNYYEFARKLEKLR